MKKFVGKLLGLFARSRSAHDVRPYLKYPDPIEMFNNSKSDMERIFYSHNGRTTYKWHHYLELYDIHMKRFRNNEVRVLEIGVQTGGSLQIWRKYFGQKAIIFGIDIDQRCT